VTRGEGDEPGELVKTLKHWTLAGYVQSHIYWSASCVHGPQFRSMSKWLCATLFHFIGNSSLLMTLREFSVCFLGTLLLFPTFFTFLLYRNFGFADVLSIDYPFIGVVSGWVTSVGNMDFLSTPEKVV